MTNKNINKVKIKLAANLSASVFVILFVLLLGTAAVTSASNTTLAFLYMSLTSFWIVADVLVTINIAKEQLAKLEMLKMIPLPLSETPSIKPTK